jgi:hypothetical protein
VEEIMEIEGEKRDICFDQLIALQSTDEEGCTHSEYRVYRIWWMAVFKGVDMARPELEWNPETNECKWGSSYVNREDLRKWVMDEIAYRTPGGQIPSRLRQIRAHLEPTEEQKRKILSRYFREPEDLKDQARRWWRLVKERSLGVQDLAEELNRIREESESPKEWINAIRRTAGRNRQESLLSDERLSWRTHKEPSKLVQVGRLCQVTGIQIPKRLETLLGETFATSGEGKSCFWALKDLKESRTFPKVKWKEWDKLVRSRFREEDCQEESGTVRAVFKKAEMLQVRKAAKEEDEAWRQRVEERIPDIKGRMRQEWFKYAQKRQKPRLKKPRRLVAEVLTNRPMNDGIVEEWKKMKIEVSPRYTLEEVYQKVRSRWREKWQLEWQEEEVEFRKAWDPEEQVDWSEIKNWIE